MDVKANLSQTQAFCTYFPKCIKNSFLRPASAGSNVSYFLFFQTGKTNSENICWLKYCSNIVHVCIPGGLTTLATGPINLEPPKAHTK